MRSSMDSVYHNAWHIVGSLYYLLIFIVVDIIFKE